ncbi:MAG: DUF1028 domain-containing protein [Chloroflexi bacterium]|nr:DUF1028 domain-containing protein [Chloroflexota bacterium]
MIHPSTFSIVAYDNQNQTWGIAVASKFPAAGAVVPWALAGRGAIATQAFANTSFGPNGLELLGQGLSAEKTLAQLLESDEGREARQVGIVDSEGRAATFTGKECTDWAGGVSGPGYAIQGNTLSNDQVVPAMQAAFLSLDGNIIDRLQAALLAGDRAGGDKRGRQSAALLVVKDQGGYGGYNDRMLDYRVDDDSDPVSKLGELIYLHRLHFGKSPADERIQLQGAQLLAIQKIMNQLGYLKIPSSGSYDLATREALRSFTGNENFEERCDPSAGWIDAPIYDYLLGKFGK